MLYPCKSARTTLEIPAEFLWYKNPARRGLLSTLDGQLPSEHLEVVDTEKVSAVIAALPADDRVPQRLAETFRGLADPGRVRLILALLEAGELCVCDLSAVTGLTQTACSHNLRLLRSSNLVRYRKQGRNVYYALDDAHIRLLLDVALQHVTHSD